MGHRELREIISWKEWAVVNSWVNWYRGSYTFSFIRTNYSADYSIFINHIMEQIVEQIIVDRTKITYAWESYKICKQARN